MPLLPEAVRIFYIELSIYFGTPKKNRLQRAAQVINALSIILHNLRSKDFPVETIFYPVESPVCN
jgi:hypothetical protein